RAAAQHDLDAAAGEPADETIDSAQEIGWSGSGVALKLVDAVEHENHTLATFAGDGVETLELLVEIGGRIELEVERELSLYVERQRAATVVEQHGVARFGPRERPVAQDARFAGTRIADDDECLSLPGHERREFRLHGGTRHVARREIRARLDALSAQLA